MKKLFYFLCNAVSVLLIVVALAVLLTSVLSRQNNLPNLMGYSVYQVMTGSMEPTLGVNDLILVKETDEINEGEIIAFYSNDPEIKGAVVTHRVVEINGDEITTKGDANAIVDLYPAEHIVGVVVYKSSALGELVRVLSQPLIFAIVIILPLAYLLISNLVRTIVLARKLANEEAEEEMARLNELLNAKKENGTGEEKDEIVREEQEDIGTD